MQSSTVVRLEAGKSYYIEVVGSNEDGPNHLSVGVQLPNGLMLRPIPGEFLNRTPFIEKELTLFPIGEQIVRKMGSDREESPEKDETPPSRSTAGNDDIASLIKARLSDSTAESPINTQPG